MAQTTGIGWTDATCNFVIGCHEAGPGCEGCYAAAFAKRKWNIHFVPGGERRETKSGFTDPYKWERAHRAGLTVTKSGKPVPRWVFACSLSDFFDKEWPDGVRDRAWKVIRETPHLYWQIVTKRVGNVERMLPKDWYEGSPGDNYPHVGIIATMVNQDEVNRDWRKLQRLKMAMIGVRWIGLSIEPQIGPVDLSRVVREEGSGEQSMAYDDNALTGFIAHKNGGWNGPALDWVITGGESRQPGHPARPYSLSWPQALIDQCRGAGVPVFVKQMGDAPTFGGKPADFVGKGDDPEAWPASLRVQEMPRIYDGIDRDTRQLELV